MSRNGTPMNDGGPAFPVPLSKGCEGMSLRDYFAIKALQGFLSNPQLAGGEPNILSKDAYDYADAMIKQREKKN